MRLSATMGSRARRQSWAGLGAVLLQLFGAGSAPGREPLLEHVRSVDGLQDARGADVEVHAAEGRLTLRPSGAGPYAWATVPAPPGGWPLGPRAAVEARITNRGDAPADVALWVVAKAGWESVGAFHELAAGEGKTFMCALRETFPDRTPKLDPARVAGVQVMLRRPRAGQVIEVRDFEATGAAAAWQPPADRLEVPALEDGPPAAGRRVRWPVAVGAAGSSGTPRESDGTKGNAREERLTVDAIVYLPPDWRPDRRQPVIVEFPGNIWFTPGCYSTGRPEQCVIGYGMSSGRGSIWISLPFVDAQGRVAEHGWGDPDATVAVCVRAVQQVCEQLGGDRERLVLTGFSRGAIACGFIGLRDDRIAGLWRGLHCCQHFDGDGWNGATLDGALERARRFKGAAVFHTDNAPERIRPLEEPFGAPVTIVQSGLGAHSSAMFLDDRESTRRLREWYGELIRRSGETSRR
jgi:hypothetical protein